MKRSIVAAGLVAALLFAVSSATAAGPNVPWTAKDMKTAIRAVGYPKPHPVKLACKGLGTQDSSGRFAAFRCTATYRHSIRRRFYIQGKGEGGWLCAGKTLTTCKVLPRGFVPSSQFTYGVQGAAEVASTGYMQNTYGIGAPSRTGPCTQSTSSAWTCGYWSTDTTKVDVTVTVKPAKGGYAVSAVMASAQ